MKILKLPILKIPNIIINSLLHHSKLTKAIVSISKI